MVHGYREETASLTLCTNLLVGISESSDPYLRALEQSPCPSNFLIGPPTQNLRIHVRRIRRDTSEIMVSSGRARVQKQYTMRLGLTVVFRDASQPSNYARIRPLSAY
jgi:hypothetical protein